MHIFKGKISHVKHLPFGGIGDASTVITFLNIGFENLCLLEWASTIITPNSIQFIINFK